MSEHQILFPKAETAELVACERDASPLKPNEVTGRTLCSLISNGTELNVYLGNYIREGLAWGRFPFVPGYAASFAVEAVGADVHDIKPGDVCFCMGLHRTFQRDTRDKILPLPPGLSPEIAPFARLMNVTMTSLTLTTARPPGLVVVTGLGPIGLMGALIFQRTGYRVIGVDPHDGRRAAAAELGLQDVRPAVPVDDAAVANRVSLVLECSAHEKAVLDGLAVIEKGGELILVGVPMTRRTEIYAQEITNRIFRRVVTVRSGNEWQVPLQTTEFRKNTYFGNLEAALRWLADGSVPVTGSYMKVAPTNPQSLYDSIRAQTTAKPSVLLDWTTFKK
jgi:threonine dehydrogenase-like Zn-dependent dehydrogenase